MSRVHCSACGTAVVVDPSGLCPDGHHLGSAGARVAKAMGSEVPHADEPQPWVAQVVLDDDPTPTATVPRRARPVSVPGIEVAADDQESLLQELHALAEFDLDGFEGGSSTPSSPPTPAPRPAPTSAPAPTPSPQAQEPTQPVAERPGSTHPARGDELAALEAALHDLSLPDEGTPVRAPADGSERTGDDSTALLDGLAGLAELDELFAAPAASTPSTPAPPTDLNPPAETDPSPPAEAGPDTARIPPDARAADPDTGSAQPDARAADPDAGSAQGPPLPPTPLAPAPPTRNEDTPAPAGAPANLDITNFTAKGGKVGTRKRLFGR